MSGSTLFGQERKPVSFTERSSLGLYTGLVQLKELNLLPKVHRGLLFSLGYSYYGRESMGSAFEFQAAFAKLKTKYEGAASSQFVQLEASYAYLLDIAARKDAFSFSGGPYVGAAYNLGFYPNWDDSHLYWADYLGIGGRSLFLFRHGTKTFVVKASVPLFSFITRPEQERPYKIDDVSLQGIVHNMNSHWEPACWNKMRTFKGEVDYKYSLGSRWSQSVGYSFRYLNMIASDSNPMHQLQHRIGVKMYF